MRTDKLKKYLLPNLPYLFIAWACLKVGTAYRLAAGADLAHKLVGMVAALGPVFADFAPGLMPPTRWSRYCCSVLKERGGRGRFITTGVRWAESVKRKNNRGIYETTPSDPKKKIILNNDNDDRRRLFETCALKAKRTCNPIIDWTDREIWDYIRAEHIPINPLYECGYSRVGCIGCPMAGTAGRQRGFARYPNTMCGEIIAAMAGVMEWAGTAPAGTTVGATAGMMDAAR